MCGLCVYVVCFFFFKQKTAYDMRISDWSSDVCSSDLYPFARSWPMGLPDRSAGVRKVRGELPEIAPKAIPKELRKDFSQSGQSLDDTRPQVFGRRDRKSVV